MKKLYDLSVKTREYTNQSGEKKAVWQNVGAVMEHDGNKFITIERWFNPAGIPAADGRSTIIVSMFAPRESNDQVAAPARQAPAAPASAADDDIPF